MPLNDDTEQVTREMATTRARGQTGGISVAAPPPVVEAGSDVPEANVPRGTSGLRGISLAPVEYQAVPVSQPQAPRIAQEAPEGIRVAPPPTPSQPAGQPPMPATGIETTPQVHDTALPTFPDMIQEADFQGWYRKNAKKTGIDENPDNPAHQYDYRRAFLAGAAPNDAGHWPSEHKLANHPNRYVDGIDTITGQPAHPAAIPTLFPGITHPVAVDSMGLIKADDGRTIYSPTGPARAILPKKAYKQAPPIYPDHDGIYRTATGAAVSPQQLEPIYGIARPDEVVTGLPHDQWYDRQKKAYEQAAASIRSQGVTTGSQRGTERTERTGIKTGETSKTPWWDITSPKGPLATPGGQSVVAGMEQLASTVTAGVRAAGQLVITANDYLRSLTHGPKPIFSEAEDSLRKKLANPTEGEKAIAEHIDKIVQREVAEMGQHAAIATEFSREIFVSFVHTAVILATAGAGKAVEAATALKDITLKNTLIKGLPTAIKFSAFVYGTTTGDQPTRMKAAARSFVFMEGSAVAGGIPEPIVAKVVATLMNATVNAESYLAGWEDAKALAQKHGGSTSEWFIKTAGPSALMDAMFGVQTKTIKQARAEFIQAAADSGHPAMTDYAVQEAMRGEKPETPQEAFEGALKTVAGGGPSTPTEQTGQTAAKPAISEKVEKAPPAPSETTEREKEHEARPEGVAVNPERGNAGPHRVPVRPTGVVISKNEEAPRSVHEARVREGDHEGTAGRVEGERKPRTLRGNIPGREEGNRGDQGSVRTVRGTVGEGNRQGNDNEAAARISTLGNVAHAKATRTGIVIFLNDGTPVPITDIPTTAAIRNTDGGWASIVGYCKDGGKTIDCADGKQRTVPNDLQGWRDMDWADRQAIVDMYRPKAYFDPITRTIKMAPHRRADLSLVSHELFHASFIFLTPEEQTAIVSEYGSEDHAEQSQNYQIGQFPDTPGGRAMRKIYDGIPTLMNEIQAIAERLRSADKPEPASERRERYAATPLDRTIATKYRKDRWASKEGAPEEDELLEAIKSNDPLLPYMALEYWSTIGFIEVAYNENPAITKAVEDAISRIPIVPISKTISRLQGYPTERARAAALKGYAPGSYISIQRPVNAFTSMEGYSQDLADSHGGKFQIMFIVPGPSKGRSLSVLDGGRPDTEVLYPRGTWFRIDHIDRKTDPITVVLKETKPQAGVKPERFAAERWYSPLQRAVESIKQEKMQPDQLKGMASKMAGVKAQEMEETGFGDWLDLLKEQKKPVTRTEALDFLKQNGVQIQEVVKRNPNEAEINALADRMFEAEVTPITDLMREKAMQGMPMYAAEQRLQPGRQPDKGDEHEGTEDIRGYEAGIRSTRGINGRDGEGRDALQRLNMAGRKREFHNFIGRCRLSAAGPEQLARFDRFIQTASFTDEPASTGIGQDLIAKATTLGHTLYFADGINGRAFRDPTTRTIIVASDNLINGWHEIAHAMAQDPSVKALVDSINLSDPLFTRYASYQMGDPITAADFRSRSAATGVPQNDIIAEEYACDLIAKGAIVPDYLTGQVAAARLSVTGKAEAPELYAAEHLTETPAFKQWFGDSKVVDDEGKPMVMYHGTGADFDIFDIGRAGQNFGAGERGAFFTNNRSFREYYTGTPENLQHHIDNDMMSAGIYAENAAKHTGGHPSVVPVYLSVRNPLVIDADTDGAGVLTLLETKRGFRQEILDQVAEGHHDGIIARDLGFRVSPKQEPETIVVVFDHNQIRSAISEHRFAAERLQPVQQPDKGDEHEDRATQDRRRDDEGVRASNGPYRNIGTRRTPLPERSMERRAGEFGDILGNIRSFCPDRESLDELDKVIGNATFSAEPESTHLGQDLIDAAAKIGYSLHFANGLGKPGLVSDAAEAILVRADNLLAGWHEISHAMKSETPVAILIAEIDRQHPLFIRYMDRRMSDAQTAYAINARSQATRIPVVDVMAEEYACDLISKNAIVPPYLTEAVGNARLAVTGKAEAPELYAAARKPTYMQQLAEERRARKEATTGAVASVKNDLVQTASGRTVGEIRSQVEATGLMPTLLQLQNELDPIDAKLTEGEGTRNPLADAIAAEGGIKDYDRTPGAQGLFSGEGMPREHYENTPARHRAKPGHGHNPAEMLNTLQAKGLLPESATIDDMTTRLQEAESYSEYPPGTEQGTAGAIRAFYLGRQLSPQQADKLENAVETVLSELGPEDRVVPTSETKAARTRIENVARIAKTEGILTERLRVADAKRRAKEKAARTKADEKIASYQEAQDNMGRKVTGIKNAQVDAEREARGQAPLMSEGKLTFQDVWDQASEVNAMHPDRVISLISALDAKPRATTPLEEAMLLHERVTRSNKLDMISMDIDAAHEANDQAALETGKANLTNVQSTLDELDKVLRTAGTASGRSLSFRRMMAADDYSLATVLRRVKAAQDGKPLSDEQLEKYRKLCSDYKAAQKKLAAYEAEKATRAANAQEQDIRETLGKAFDKAVREAVKLGKTRLPASTLSYFDEQANQDIADLAAMGIEKESPKETYAAEQTPGGTDEYERRKQVDGDTNAPEVPDHGNTHNDMARQVKERFFRSYEAFLYQSESRILEGVPQGRTQLAASSEINTGPSRGVEAFANSKGYRVFFVHGVTGSLTDPNNKVMIINADATREARHEALHITPIDIRNAAIDRIDINSKKFRSIEQNTLRNMAIRAMYRDTARAELQDEGKPTTEKAITNRITRDIAEELIADHVAGLNRSGVALRGITKTPEDADAIMREFDAVLVESPKEAYAAERLTPEEERDRTGERYEAAGNRTPSYTDWTEPDAATETLCQLLRTKGPHFFYDSGRNAIKRVRVSLNAGRYGKYGDEAQAILDAAVPAEERFLEQRNLDYAARFASRGYTLVFVRTPGLKLGGVTLAQDRVVIVADVSMLPHEFFHVLENTGDPTALDLKSRIDTKHPAALAYKNAARRKERGEQPDEALAADIAADVWIGYDRFDLPLKDTVRQTPKEAYAAAWHGSPHEFEEFKTKHIGTGEGAQAYGWGLHFAATRREGIDPSKLDKLAGVGSALIAHGYRQSEPWKAKMREQFGDIEPYLDGIFLASWPKFRERMDAAEVKGVTKTAIPIKTYQDEETGEQYNDVSAYAKELVREQLEAGERDPAKIFPAVTKIIQETIPEITQRQVEVEFCDYGKVTLPSKDQIDVAMGDIRAQEQKLLAIEDVMHKLAPLKSGSQRGKPSDTVRELTRKLQAMIKEAGLKVTDPEQQLKSALGAIKTHLNNSIRDIEKALRTGQRMVKNNVPVPYDSEATALQERRDELRAMYDEVFAKPELTDGQRLNIALRTAQRSAVAWDQRLKDAQDGIWKGPKQPGKPLPASAELDAIKAQRDAAKAQVTQLEQAAFPGGTPRQIESLIKAARTRNAKRLDQYQTMITTGNYARPAKKPPKVLPYTDQDRAQQADLERMSDKIDDARYEDMMKNRPPWEKALDLFASWGKFRVISGLRTLAKVISYTPVEVASTIPREIIGGILTHTPGFRETAAGAPKEGHLDVGALRSAMKALVTRGWQSAVRASKSQRTDIEAKNETMRQHPRGVLGTPGQVHQVEKEFAKEFGFELSRSKRISHAIRQGRTLDEKAIEEIEQAAYDDAKQTILMENNRVAQALRAATQKLEKPHGAKAPDVMGKIAATVVRTELPVIQVPPNHFKAVMEYIFGAAYGGGRQLYHGVGAPATPKRWKLNRIEDLTNTQRDAIMRQLKRGAVGAAFGMYALWDAWKHGPDSHFGGLYQPRKKRDDDKEHLRFGEMRIGGQRVWAMFMAHPLMINAQFWATVGHVLYDIDHPKHRDEAYETPAVNIPHAILTATVDLIETAPVVDESLRISKMLDPQVSKYAAAEWIRGHIEPIFIDDIAKLTDLTPDWTAAERRPQSSKETFMMGIPGLRGDVTSREYADWMKKEKAKERTRQR